MVAELEMLVGPNPHVASEATLWPPSVIVPPQSGPAELSSRTEFVTAMVPLAFCTALSGFAENVSWVMLNVPPEKIAPPFPGVAVLDTKVLLVTVPVRKRGDRSSVRCVVALERAVADRQGAGATAILGVDCPAVGAGGRIRIEGAGCHDERARRGAATSVGNVDCPAVQVRQIVGEGVMGQRQRARSHVVDAPTVRRMPSADRQVLDTDGSRARRRHTDVRSGAGAVERRRDRSRSSDVEGVRRSRRNVDYDRLAVTRTGPCHVECHRGSTESLRRTHPFLDGLARTAARSSTSGRLKAMHIVDVEGSCRGAR